MGNKGYGRYCRVTSKGNTGISRGTVYSVKEPLIFWRLS